MNPVYPFRFTWDSYVISILNNFVPKRNKINEARSFIKRHLEEAKRIQKMGTAPTICQHYKLNRNILPAKLSFYKSQLIFVVYTEI